MPERLNPAAIAARPGLPVAGGRPRMTPSRGNEVRTQPAGDGRGMGNDEVRVRGDVAVLVSGGVDSAVLVVTMLDHHARVFPVYVRFGLRWEDVELAHLRRFLDAVRGDRPGIQELTVLDEPIAQVYGEHWSNAGRPGVPGAETEDDAVYLPGRNVLLAAKTAVWCHLRGIGALAFGILAANPFPDSDPEFFRDLAAVLNRALGGRLTILRPFAGLAKSEVVARAVDLPLHLTFSCLNPRDGLHCGACNKCAERRKGFETLGRIDRTEYAAPRTAAAP